jgi:hypothetical protein
MRLNTLLLIAGLIALVFGLGFLVFPIVLLAQYGLHTDGVGILMSRFFGSALIELGLVLYLVRNVADLTSQRGIAIAGFLGSLVGMAVAFRAQYTGLLNSLGWSTVAIYALLALGYASSFFRPSPSPKTQ